MDWGLELRPGYDLGQLHEGGACGKYAKRYHTPLPFTKPVSLAHFVC